MTHETTQGPTAPAFNRLSTYELAAETLEPHHPLQVEPYLRAVWSAAAGLTLPARVLLTTLAMHANASGVVRLTKGEILAASALSHGKYGAARAELLERGLYATVQGENASQWLVVLNVVPERPWATPGVVAQAGGALTLTIAPERRPGENQQTLLDELARVGLAGRLLAELLRSRLSRHIGISTRAIRQYFIDPAHELERLLAEGVITEQRLREAVVACRERCVHIQSAPSGNAGGYVLTVSQAVRMPAGDEEIEYWDAIEETERAVVHLLGEAAELHRRGDHAGAEEILPLLERRFADAAELMIALDDGHCTREDALKAARERILECWSSGRTGWAGGGYSRALYPLPARYASMLPYPQVVR